MAHLLITLVGSALIGVINGLLIVVARIDSFIATLGTGSLLLAFVWRYLMMKKSCLKRGLSALEHLSFMVFRLKYSMSSY